MVRGSGIIDYASPFYLLVINVLFTGGLSYITQNIPGNMMQKTIIIVQGPTGGGPLTLTVGIRFCYTHFKVGHIEK